MKDEKPALFTALSPALLHLYDVSSSIVVIIDVLRATSTIATALHTIQFVTKALYPTATVNILQCEAVPAKAQ